MNNPNLKNVFNKFLGGASLSSVLLFGFGYLALNSYYYGTSAATQSMSATTPSSSINSSD